MPMPYAHLSLAHGCLQQLTVSNHQDFYLGAISPDMRYFTRQPREHYHLSLDSFDRLASTTNTPESFLLGYRVHLIIDELWYAPTMAERYRRAFFFALRPKLSPKLLESAFEFFCLTQRPVTTQLQARENGLTKALGVKLDDLQRAIDAMQRYMAERSLQVGLDIAEGTGLYAAERLDQMRRLAQTITSHVVWRVVVALLVNPPSRQIHTYIVDQVITRLAQVQQGVRE